MRSTQRRTFASILGSKRLAALVLSVALLAGCGPGLITSVKLGIASSRPFVQSLVPKVITQAKADSVTQDLNDGVDSAARGEGCIKAIVVSGAAKRVAKAKCLFAVAQDLRGILARHNFGGDDTLNQISTIIAGAIAAFEAYYVTVNAPAFTGSADDGKQADKRLEKTLKDLNRQMRELVETK